MTDVPASLEIVVLVCISWVLAACNLYFILFI